MKSRTGIPPLEKKQYWRVLCRQGKNFSYAISTGQFEVGYIDLSSQAAELLLSVSKMRITARSPVLSMFEQDISHYYLHFPPSAIPEAFRTHPRTSGTHFPNWTTNCANIQPVLSRQRTCLPNLGILPHRTPTPSPQCTIGMEACR